MQTTIKWDGITKAETLHLEHATIRQNLADHAKRSDWRKMLEILAAHPDLVNTTRPGGHSLYTPLHQTAYNGAPVEVLHKLIEFGAWRTLRNASRECAMEIARRCGHNDLISILQPQYARRVPAETLSVLQAHFHAVINGRAGHLVREHALRLPELEPLLEFYSAEVWFAVPGMYGGFKYWLASDGPEATLITESSCRVVGGSGQRHHITAAGLTLVAEGFV